jgi:hypothetical protein
MNMCMSARLREDGVIAANVLMLCFTACDVMHLLQAVQRLPEFFDNM